MSFIGVVEKDLDEVGQAALNAAKYSVGYVDNVIVIDIIPALERILKNAIEKLGQEAVAALLGSALNPSASTATTDTSATGT